jgi:hypothetical protein
LFLRATGIVSGYDGWLGCPNDDGVLSFLRYILITIDWW